MAATHHEAIDGLIQVDFHCAQCGHGWHQDLAAEMGAFVRQMKVIRCPSCGAGPKKVMMGEPKEPAPL